MPSIAKMVRKRQAVMEGMFTPEMADKVCFVCGFGFDPLGPKPTCIVPPGSRDAKRYYPLGLYTHKSHVTGSQYWYESLDPRDSRDISAINSYSTHYGPHPGKPNGGESSSNRIDRLTLPLSEAPPPAQSKVATLTTDGEPRKMGVMKKLLHKKMDGLTGETAGPPIPRSMPDTDRPTPVQKKPKAPPDPNDPATKVSVALNGLDMAALKKIALANGLKSNWEEKWSKLPNPGLVRMNLGNTLRARVKKGEKVKL